MRLHKPRKATQLEFEPGLPDPVAKLRPARVPRAQGLPTWLVAEMDSRSFFSPKDFLTTRGIHLSMLWGSLIDQAPSCVALLLLRFP